MSPTSFRAFSVWNTKESASFLASIASLRFLSCASNEVGDKVPESDKTQVQADLEAVKAILERTKDQEMSDSDVDELKAAKEKLTQSAQSVFTKMYEQAAQAQQGAQGAAGPDMNAQAGSNAGSNADDDVIDGDFREV